MTDATNNQPAEPTTAPEAAARLNLLTADAQWAQSVIANEPVAKAQFDKLTRLVAEAEGTAKEIVDTAGRSPAADALIGSDPEAAKLADAVEMLRMAGMTDDVIKEFFEGKPGTRRDYEATKRFQAMRHGDAGWVERYLKGGFEEKREAILMASILNRGFKEENAA